MTRWSIIGAVRSTEIPGWTVLSSAARRSKNLEASFTSFLLSTAILPSFQLSSQTRRPRFRPPFTRRCLRAASNTSSLHTMQQVGKRTSRGVRW